MKINYLIITAAVLLGFAAGIGSRLLGPRYELISGTAGNAFRFNARTGDTWLITSSGHETLVTPPEPQVPLNSARSVYDELKNAKALNDGPNPPKTLRDWAILMNRLTAKDGGASSGIYDAAAQKGSE